MADDHFRRLERMYHAAPINRWYAPTLTVRDGEAELSIPLRGDFHHGAGAAHGSVLFKALDDACFFAANSLVPEAFVLTASFSLHFLRPVVEGTIRAHGRVVHRSGSSWIADGVVRDDAGRELARGTGTFVRSKIALDTLPGY